MRESERSIAITGERKREKRIEKDRAGVPMLPLIGEPGRQEFMAKC